MQLKLQLHWQILIGMCIGILIGIIAVFSKVGSAFILDWVAPFGTIFIRLLKMIAIPLILASLIKGVSDLKDFASFSQMGLRTVLLYISTTFIAIIIGLVSANTIAPGKDLDPTIKTKFAEQYNQTAASKIQGANAQKELSPLQPLVDIVPENILSATTNNRMMLQVIFFAIFFGVGMLLVSPAKVEVVKQFFDGFNDIILKLVDIIMLYAPIGVAALMSKIIVETPSASIFIELSKYMGTVLLGLVLMIGVYLTLVYTICKHKPLDFLKGIAPAQLLAFSTSSSAATLPVTMERVEEHLGVDQKVTSFVLPIGATINMDGTSLYQAVAAIFIANVYSIDLDLADQLTIVLTALLASIGSAAVPGAGILMLVIVLESIGVPTEGIVMILGVDRILDMCRTTINITGDATIALIVGKQMDAIGPPSPKNWDDNLIA